MAQSGDSSGGEGRLEATTRLTSGPTGEGSSMTKRVLLL
jgi:hypothetical protein